ncbi:MAG: ATP-binding protein [Bacteroides sp.]|nr:ATP-binding protein [Bacteroides sp.]
MLTKILTDLNVGWWRFNVKTFEFTFSAFVQDLLKLGSDTTTGNDFVKMVRKDYREKLLKNLSNSFRTESVFSIQTPPDEAIWIRSRHVGSNPETGQTDMEFGYFQVIPSPEIISPEQRTSLRLNNLLYQMNSVSEILLSFLRSEDPAQVIHHILTDILKQFSAGRTYIFEYDKEKQTQSCTYEVVDEYITPEIEILQDLSVTSNNWWSTQLLTGNPVVLNSLEELPGEAAETRELLQMQDIKSLMVVPLVSKNGVWGYVGIDVVDRYYNWTEDDLIWFSSLANIISLFIELNRSERSALFDKAQLQSLYQNMPLAYIRMKVIYNDAGDPEDYLILDANKATFDLFRIPSGRFIGVKGSESREANLNDLLFSKGLFLSGGYIEKQEWIEDIQKMCNIVIYSIGEDERVCLLSDITESYKVHEELDRSEKILRNIYDNLSVGIELYDKDGRLVDLNNSNMEMFGITKKEDVIGLNLFDDPNIPQEHKDLLKNNRPTSFRIRYTFDRVKGYFASHRKGAIEIYTRANILYDSNGEIIHYLLIHIDNTQINQAYSRIADFENSFSLISKYGRIGYCKFDLTTREGEGVPQWYANMGEKPGTPFSQIIGVYSHVHEEDRNKIFAHIGKVEAGEVNGFTEDLRVLHEDNTWRWTQINVLKNPANTDPSKSEMLCVNFDITNLKDTEQKLIEAKEKAEVSDRLKSAFIANMSHEIRTPLNAIVGFSGVLAETESDDEKNSYVNIIQKNNELLLQLISDILDLSKIEAGTMELLYDELDLHALCQEIVQTYNMKLQSAPVEVRYGEHFSPCVLRTDKNRLMQVIGNFMNNAIKFTPEGAITVGFYKEGKDKVRIYVQDTGCGIPEKEHTAIFQRFVKLDDFAQGTGLGLSICKSIAEQMGVRSE